MTPPAPPSRLLIALRNPLLTGALLVLTLVQLLVLAAVVLELQRVRATVRSELGTFATSLDGALSRPVELRVPIKQTVPVQATIPINQRFIVPVDTTIVIDRQITIPFKTPLGTYNYDFPLKTSVPIKVDVPVNLQTTVPVSTSVALDLDVPISVDLADTPVAQLVQQLRAAIARISSDL